MREASHSDSFADYVSMPAEERSVADFEDHPSRRKFARQESLGEEGGAGATARLIELGAYSFVWVIGVVASIKLLTDFSSVLKPLVMSALFVSILEVMVRFWERFIWKVSVFVSLIVRKVWVMSRILWCGMRGCLTYVWCQITQAHITYSVSESSAPFRRELCRWEPLRKKWHGSFAGQNAFLRFVAVLITLVIVGFIGFGFTLILINGATQMKGRLTKYTDNAAMIAQALHEQLLKLPDAFPDGSEYQNQTKSYVQKTEALLNTGNLLASFQANLHEFLETFLDSTYSILYSAVFFILYTFLWLFDPMHLNANTKKAQEFKMLYLRRNSSQSNLEFDESHSHPTQEYQEHLHEIMWQYFLRMVLLNLLYATSVLTLLGALDVDLAGFIAGACFFLSFIPELGAIVCTFLPLPLVILAPMDGVHSGQDHDEISQQIGDVMGRRWMKLLYVFAGMLAIKFVVGNWITAVVMGNNKVLAGGVANASVDEDIKVTHPVMILFVVVLAGEIWGPVGMLISVPVISVVRLMLNVYHMEAIKKKKKPS